ncbi:MAG: cobalt ECF transporter T component CbiQ [Candidatus Aureabacteria bacterium]|nr:cobalt ECF transporter T component CbiQ [Candidatus Auribacterota bacterium]
MHRTDARVKCVACVCCVLLIVTTPATAVLSFTGYALILLALLAVSRVPILHIVRRTLAVMPFVLLIAACLPFIKRGEVMWSVAWGGWTLAVTRDGLRLFWGVFVKSSLSIFCVALLTATTRFDCLLRGMESLRCPRLVVMLLSFLYRYAFLFSDDLMRMLRAKRSRSFRPARSEARILAGMLGMLFVRSYERAERVYLAMCSRGFDGTIVTPGRPALGAADLALSGGVIACFAAARLAGGIW